MTRWLVLAVCSFLLQLPAAPRARAQAAEPPVEVEGGSDAVIAEARVHVQKGVELYSEGDLNAARVELERAYELQPSYRLLYNLGQVAFEQRDYPAAERYYRDYLNQGGEAIEAERRADVERDLQRLQERVANVSIESNIAGAKLFVDGREVGHAPLTESLRLSAGRRVFRAEAPGRAPVSREVDVIGGEQRHVELAFGPALIASEQGARAGSSALHPALWTGIATGVLAIGAGGMAFWAGVDDREYDRELERRTTRARLDAIADRTKTKALIADVLLGAAVASAAATVVLLLVVDGEQEREPAVAVGPGSLRVEF
jgi:tetratricopeptide (TPR) repeat protein